MTVDWDIVSKTDNEVILKLEDGVQIKVTKQLQVYVKESEWHGETTVWVEEE